MNSFNSLPGPRIIFLDCGQLNQEWSWLVLKTVSRDSSLIFRMAIKCPVSSLRLLKISSSFVWACILQGSRVFCNKLQEFNQISLVCNLLRRQNSISETKIFTKILQYARGDLLLRLLAATCCCNMSPCVFRPWEAEAAGKNALPKPESAHEESVAPRVSITS